MAVGSLIDIGIGVALVAVLGGTARRSLALRAGVAGVAVVVLLVTLVDFDTRRMASAVYRDGCRAAARQRAHAVQPRRAHRQHRRLAARSACAAGHQRQARRLHRGR